MMRFLKTASVTLVFKFSAILFGLGISIIISRTLGPSGRGVYGLIMTIIMLASTFAAFGFNTANTYYLSKNNSLAGLFGRRSLIIGLVGVVVSTLVVMAVYVLRPNFFQGMDPYLISLTMVLVLSFLWGKYISQAFLGLQKIVAFNLFPFAERLIFFALAVILLIGFDWQITGYVSSVTLILFLFTCGYVFYFFKQNTFDFDNKPVSLMESFLYGVRPYTAALFTMLTLRSGMFFVNYFSGTESTGLFAVAQQMSELLIIFPSVIGNVLFPRVAGDNSVTLTAQVVRTTVLLFLPLFLIVALFAQPIISLLFGSEFLSASTALLIMLPGAFLLGLEVIMAGDIAGRGYPWGAALVWVPASIINILGYLWLIPLFGIEGAAASSSVVFSLLFVYITIYLKKMTSVQLKELFMPTREDVKKLLSLPKALVPSRFS